MNHFSKIFKQTSWQVAGKVVTSASTFIILGLVARNYGKEGTGIFTLALTYLAMFYMLADFGFNAHVLKKGDIEWNKLLGARIIWSGVLVVLALGLLPFLPFKTPLFSNAVLFGVLAIFGSSVFTTCNLIFQKKLRYDLSVLASSIGTIISLLIFVGFVSFKFPVSSLLFAHFIGWIIIAFFALILVRKFLRNVFPLYDIRYTLYLFKDSWPIAATLALNVIYFRADSFMIAYFKNTADVGIYNIAYSIFQTALVLPTFIMNAYYPLMLKSLKKIKLIGLSLLGLAFIGTIFTIIFAPFVIKILTGGGFEGSVASLQILSLGFPAYFLSALLMWLLITKGKYKQMFAIYAFGLLVNIILNFIYIPQSSFIAASWTTVISEYLILILQILILRR
ncbi:MAG: flippase [Candidatus Daviesbacteria bacterium]|nr:flippase [Candidatus Daviesbacteria bacterium]